ncbi:MAG TPA: hypothetical protein VLL52_19405 [Anaerolineae bacterium]|nr:hypothetical protein [Anaerolineae bacterium]
MSQQFEWEVEDDESRAVVGGEGRGVERRYYYWLAILILILMIVAGGYYFSWRRLKQMDETLVVELQATVDLGHQAWAKGDRELMEVVVGDEGDWLLAQLRPELQRQWAAEGEVVAAAREDLGMASSQVAGAYGQILWQDEGGAWYTVAMFERRAGGWVYRWPEGDWGGERKRFEADWGDIYYRDGDGGMVGGVAELGGRVRERVCGESGCGAKRLNLMLMWDLAEERVVANGRYHLSPQLVGMTAEGEPTAEFWASLEGVMVDYWRPERVLRVAVMPDEPRRLRPFAYEQLAATFAAENPGVAVEVEVLKRVPVTAEEVAGFDVVMMTPPVGWVAAGMVQDLSLWWDEWEGQEDIMWTVWRGTSWRGKVWMMPLTVETKPVFYDKRGWERVENLSLLPLEMSYNNLSAWPFLMGEGEAEAFGFDAFFLDVSQNSLFAVYVGGLARCPHDCWPEMYVDSALDWYQFILDIDNHELEDIVPAMIDTTELTAEERALALYRWQSVERRALVWVDEWERYEQVSLMAPIGIDRFPTPPLWVDGGFVLAASEQAEWGWRWLVFMSEQVPQGRFRLVPARLSVAERSGFWAGLPEAVRPVLEGMMANGEGVNLAERGLFEPEVVGAVVAGEMTREEGVRLMTREVKWFGGGD